MTNNEGSKGFVKNIKNLIKGDHVIWTVFLALCLVSILEVYSASSALGYKSGNYWYAALYHTLLLGVGFVFMIVMSNIQCRYFKAVAPLFVLISIILLLSAILFGEKVNDAARWIKVFGIPLQPSEIAKGSMVMITAKILSQFQTPEGADPKAFKNILWAGLFLIVPIFPENFSTALLISSVVFLMMIIGRIPIRQIGKLLSIGTGLVISLVLVVVFVGESKPNTMDSTDMQYVETMDARSENRTESTSVFGKVFHRINLWHQRMDDWMKNEYVAPEEYDLDKYCQIGHSHIAIAKGFLLGNGPGKSEQRDLLPLAFSDFIYAIILEEYGWVGAAFVAFLYIILLFRTGIIANTCKNSFPAFLAMGLALLIVIQALFNMGVAVGLFPVTGQPLPLISKGGTSSIINCIYIGMILSVSRTAEKKQTSQTSK